MTIVEQINATLWQSWLSLRHIKRRTAASLLVYFATGCIIFIICGSLLLHHQESLKQLLLDYLFPESWQSISEQMFSFFFESQAKQVLANLIISGSLVVASIFLFPIKERLSANFESDLNLPLGKAEEFSLLRQGVEETRLIIFYLTAQLIILWVGYYPYSWANTLSITLSYVFLFYTFALDIIAPTLQRHQMTYGRINKLLAKNLLAAMIFGLCFSLPALFIGQWLMSQEDYNLLEISLILFLVNLLFIAWSIPIGTYLAIQLRRRTNQVKAISSSTTVLSYLVTFVLLTGGLLLHGRLLQSMHHKSQVLKANYDLDWSSFSLELHSLGEALSQRSIGQLSFDLLIENPTEYDLVFEDSEILLDKYEQPISRIAIKGFAVPAGDTHHLTMQIDVTSDFSSISDYSSALEGWRMEYRLQLFPGIPFIVEIYDHES
ncbi:hypothetical protein [Pleionea litopenaei]|uniref:Uncharacterized protein n=1 Tax=Pleionea litopenaei TaxID=3070815 RepID=A0AA51X5Z4_9GAMM|nr:hypothetical protein [Pleionea sp. HL-JVS1]WMS86722.1 hypothetical protein Q9312_15990 [Pleionea sp. HL-JVS1]